MSEVGNWFKAQQAFAKCSGGVSISEWCAVAQDVCCAVCPNAPITGPGTIIVFGAGTFFNLLVGLFWKVESPYNLFFGLLGTDGAFFALLDRTLEPASEFHAAFVPLAIMSVIPVVVAVSLAEVEYLHTMHSRPKLPSFKRKPKEQRPPMFRKRTPASPKYQEENQRAPEFKKRPWLPVVASIAFVAHLVAWLIFFPIVLTSYKNPNQSNCADTFDLRRYRLIIGIVVAVFWLVGVFFVSCLIGGFSRKWRGGTAAEDAFTFMARLVHSGRDDWFYNQICPDESGYSKSRERWRFGIAIGLFFAWFACYLGIWLSALNEFVMLGSNPFDYGQVAACIGCFVPFVVAGRARMDLNDNFTAGEKTRLKHGMPSLRQLEDKRDEAASLASGAIDVSDPLQFRRSFHSGDRDESGRRSRSPSPDHHSPRRGGDASPTSLGPGVPTPPQSSHLSSDPRSTSSAGHRPKPSTTRSAPLLDHPSTAGTAHLSRRSDASPSRSSAESWMAQPDDLHVMSGGAGGLLEDHPGMSEKFGYYFAAQKAFSEECTGGLTMGQYCAASRDVCCGLCQVIPITGFGTFLTFVLGTLCNLLIALWWKPETPYNLGLQFLTVDGIALSLLDRFFEPKNRLSLFHYCFVPLSALSFVPILAACCTARLKYLHNVSSAAARGILSTTQERVEESAAAAAANASAPRRSTSAVGVQHSLPHAGRPRPVHNARTKSTPNEKFTAPKEKPEKPNASRTVSHYGGDEVTKFNPRLPGIVLWTCAGHIAAYTAIFALVFFGIDSEDTFQSNCVEEYNFNAWRIGMGVFTAVGMVCALFLWLPLYGALNRTRRKKTRQQDGLTIMITFVSGLLHLRPSRAQGIVEHKDRAQHHALTRRAAFVFYIAWVVPYIVVYFTALNTFLMQGTNPFPYEQVNGAFSILVPLIVCARSFLENKDAYNAKYPQQEAIERVSLLEAEHNSLHDAIRALDSQANSRSNSHSSRPSRSRSQRSSRRGRHDRNAAEDRPPTPDHPDGPLHETSWLDDASTEEEERGDSSSRRSHVGLRRTSESAQSPHERRPDTSWLEDESEEGGERERGNGTFSRHSRSRSRSERSPSPALAPVSASAPVLPPLGLRGIPEHEGEERAEKPEWFPRRSDSHPRHGRGSHRSAASPEDGSPRRRPSRRSSHRSSQNNADERDRSPSMAPSARSSIRRKYSDWQRALKQADTGERADGE
ncbi:hypothetical protein JCM10213_009048 [Rhodosporidiobolus nylandii]